MFQDDTPSFFQLLQFLGRKHIYPLESFLTALVLQKVSSILTDTLFLLILCLCCDLRDFCGFSKVPDASLLTGFKKIFEPLNINGHFCYYDKFAILTNGLGIVRHISFLDDSFKTAHPEMEVAFDSFDTYGFLHDQFHFSKMLIPFNPRNENTLKKVVYNIYGYPTCPNAPPSPCATSVLPRKRAKPFGSRPKSSHVQEKVCLRL